MRKAPTDLWRAEGDPDDDPDAPDTGKGGREEEDDIDPQKKKT